MSKPQELRTSWLKRRWFDFRNGHSTYLIFVIQFAQFIVITYQLYIANSKASWLFPDILHWVLFFTLSYIPAATIAGHIHRKKQMGTDQAQQIDVNPLSYKTVITDGKEALYSMRLNRINYDLQLKSMAIGNEMTRTLNKHLDSKIPLWAPEDFAQIKEFKKLTTALEQGGDVREVEFKEYDIK